MLGSTISKYSKSVRPIGFGGSANPEDEYASLFDPQELTMGGGGGSGSGSFSFFAEPSNIPPPSAPGMSELASEYAATPGYFRPKRYLKEIDAGIRESEAATAQQGQNAMRAYANRLMQMGIAPVASGVVGAQARRAGNAATGQMRRDREMVALEARKQAAQQASSIAAKMADIRNSYVQTLADYNARQTSMQAQGNQFNASQAMRLKELAQQRALQEEMLAAQYDNGTNVDLATPVVTPGYIPNMGAPITPSTVNGRPLLGQVMTPGAIANMGLRLGA